MCTRQRSSPYWSPYHTANDDLVFAKKAVHCSVSAPAWQARVGSSSYSGLQISFPADDFFLSPQQLAHVFMRHSFVQKAVLLKMLNLLVGVFENSGLGRCREDCSQHSNTVLFTWTDMELQDLCFRIVYRVDVAWGNKQWSSQYVLILLENEWWGVILFFSILAEIEESSMMVCTGRLILWLPLFFFFSLFRAIKPSIFTLFFF